MRGFVPEFDLRPGHSLKDVLKVLADYPGDYRPFAGGTDLMVLLEAGVLKHKRYIDIMGLKELRGIQASTDFIDIGACVTYVDIQANPDIRASFPSLVQAGSETGGLAIQNRGTIGGNIANASPAADSPPALISYDAQIKLISRRGERWLPYHKFHSGYKKMDLAADELIAMIRLPRPVPGTIHFYQKAGTRKAQAISKIVLAGTAVVEGGKVRDIRIVMGSVAATTLRCIKTEKIVKTHKVDEAVISGAVAELKTEIAPLDDIRSTKAFRLDVSGNVLAKFLRTLV